MKIIKNKKGIHITWELVVGLAIGIIVMILILNLVLKGSGKGIIEIGKIQDGTSPMVDNAIDSIDNMDQKVSNIGVLPKIIKTFAIR